MSNEIRVALKELADSREDGKTFCPSEAARKVSDDWREKMDEVRREAKEMGLEALQDGEPVDPVAARGPIRLRWPQ